MAKDFGQAMDKGYMIPASLAVGSGDAWDIRCQCDTVQDFKTFFTDTGMDIRFEGLVTYEKTNKKLKVYKGNDVWEDATGGAGGDVDLSNYVTLDKLNTELAKKSDIHSHPYKSDSYVPSWSEVTGKPVIPSKTSDLTNDSSFATETFVANKIAEAQLGGGEVDLSGLATKDELNTKANISHTHTEYAAKSSEHTHDNKVALDKVTDSKINSWDSKATGNHNHDGKYANTSHRHDASEIDNLPEGSSTTVIDNLTSTSATSALSAGQGKVLDDKINTLNNESVKAEDYVGGVDVSIEPNVLGRIRDIEFQVDNMVKEYNDDEINVEFPNIQNEVNALDSQVKNIVNIDMPKINSQLETKANRNELPYFNVKNFGAKGDGINDDTKAIQEAIDHVELLGGGVVYIPPTSKFYSITSNLLVSGFGGSDTKSITIKGDDKTTTKLKATNENVISVIEVVKNGYNINIENLSIEGHKNTTYGIKTSINFAISSIKNIIIQNIVNGIKIEKGTWVSNFENILIRHCENGIHFGGGCTSIYLVNSYVYNCSKVAYRLNGTYSTGVNLCADICTTPYLFEYAEWSITSIANESSECVNMFSFDNSNVTINNVRTHKGNVKNSYLFMKTKSKVKINNISISDSETESKLFDYGYGDCHLNIDFISLINSEVVKNVSYFANRLSCLYTENGDTFTYKVKSSGQNVVSKMVNNSDLIKGNITWCENKPQFIDGSDETWLNSHPKGTLHLCTKFDNKGVVGFVRCDDKGVTTYQASEYLPIASIVKGISTERPKVDLIEGQCYFDKTLGKPIWYNGTNWVESNGTIV